MPPSFSDFFKSFYYSNTYVPPVDLSDKALSKHLLKSEDANTAKIAQDLISSPEVQSVLSEPLSYQLTEWAEKNRVLENHDFKLLSVKRIFDPKEGEKLTPFYSVVEHENLPGWVIKAGAIRIQKGQLMEGPQNDKNEVAFFTEEESLLRIEMANRIAKAAKESGIDVVLPKKKLVTYKNLNRVTEATRKYCVVCEKINILGVDETVNVIKAMDEKEQKEVAQKISIIVKKAGLVDASFFNIRLTKEGKLAFIDTEPAGLMVAKKSGQKGASVEKCARIGLFTLMHQTFKREGNTVVMEPRLQPFHAQVESDYKKACKPKLSKWKITLSALSLGLIPLVNVIVALVKTHLTEKTWTKLLEFDILFELDSANRLSKSQEEQVRLTKDWEEKRTPTAKKFFSYIEGVPCSYDEEKVLKMQAKAMRNLGL